MTFTIMIKTDITNEEALQAFLENCVPTNKIQILDIEDTSRQQLPFAEYIKTANIGELSLEAQNDQYKLYQSEFADGII